MVIDGDVYIDAVYLTDANLEEAIHRGANELWVIWTVSERAVWRRGVVPTYFQVIETAANGHFRRVLERIEASNAAIERDEPGEFGRLITVHVLRQEVPVHYLFTFRRARFVAAVELGVEVARSWCRDHGIPMR